MHYISPTMSQQTPEVLGSTCQKQVKEKTSIKHHIQQKTNVQPVLSHCYLPVFWGDHDTDTMSELA